MKIRLLALVIAAALTVGAAQAKEPAKAPTAQQQATRAEIDRLIERIELLSKQLGENADVRVIVHRDGHPAPRAWEGHDSPGHSGPGLGIVMAANPAAGGVRIVAVTPDSPAMKSGIRSGDVLLSVDGKAIAGSGTKAVESARHLLADLKQGQLVKLHYARQGKTRDASVKADAISRAMMLNWDESEPMANARIMRDFSRDQRKHVTMLPPAVEREIQRMGPMHGCAPGKDDCDLPALYQAFRWQGLNLASVDASLGHYFGTDKGVLVLSSGPDIKGLQSGDVIQRVAGSEVDSPRDVMRALRDKSSGSQLKFEVLRDRKAMALNVTVPKSRPLPFMMPPPAPPAPPAPPTPPSPHAPHAAPPEPPAPPTPLTTRAPHAAPLPPSAPRAPRAAPPPPPAAPAPKDRR